MPVRIARVAVGALLLLAGMVSTGSAECRLSPEDSARLKRLSSGNGLTDQNRFHALGIFYLDHRCYAEARTAFTAALAGKEGRPTVSASTTAFLLFLDALEMRERGELKLAQEKLVEVLRQSFHTAILERVPFVLADLLSQRPNPEASKFLDEQLRAAPNGGSWMLRTILIKRLLEQGRGAEALAQTESELAGELEASRRIELQLQLAYLLFAQKRLAEAQILIAQLDEEIGETALDRGLRINFLLLAVQVWSERVRRGGDPTAAWKLEAYSKAYNQLDAAVKPWGSVQ